MRFATASFVFNSHPLPTVYRDLSLTKSAINRVGHIANLRNAQYNCDISHKGEAYMSACTFFGHRDCPSSIKTKLQEVLTDLIVNANIKVSHLGAKRS